MHRAPGIPHALPGETNMHDFARGTPRERGGVSEIGARGGLSLAMAVDGGASVRRGQIGVHRFTPPLRVSVSGR